MSPGRTSHAGDGPGVAILGLGASGAAAARLALDQGETVYVSDSNADAATAARGDELRRLGAVVELGGHDLERLASAGTVVVSPGIPPHAPVLRELRERGVGWVAEPEFAFRFLDGSLIAVTGTNGKTTVSALAAHLLETAGLRAGLGGNIGAGLGPAASELARLDPPPDWFVVEMSSFQLADIDRFRPDVGVLTNLAPDHLDRYDSVEAYYADKARLFENADARSRWVLNADDPQTLDLAGDAAGERWLFTLGVPEDRKKAGEAVPPAGGARGAPAGWGWMHGEVLTLRVDGRDEPLVSWDEVPLLGRHNRANALAAALAARLAGAEPAGLAEGLRTARALPHRLEPVAEVGGVLWVNDSKATNVAAAVSAVRSLEGRTLVLLLGGKDKGEDFRPLGPVLEGRARAALLYGAAAGRLEKELREAAGPDAPVERVRGDFSRVVARARDVAREGDVVLLAPACSSFDMFENYEARGRRFRELATGEAG